MTEKKTRQLTKFTIMAFEGFTATTPAEHFIAGFIDNVEQGLPISKETLAHLAFCLRPIIESKEGDTNTETMLEVASRLELTTRQGKGLAAQKKEIDYILSLLPYLEEKEAYEKTGLNKKRAELKARDRYRNRENIADRTVRDRISKHGKAAEKLREVNQRFRGNSQELEEVLTKCGLYPVFLEYAQLVESLRSTNLNDLKLEHEKNINNLNKLPTNAIIDSSETVVSFLLGELEKLKRTLKDHKK